MIHKHPRIYWLWPDSRVWESTRWAPSGYALITSLFARSLTQHRFIINHPSSHLHSFYVFNYFTVLLLFTVFCCTRASQEDSHMAMRCPHYTFTILYIYIYIYIHFKLHLCTNFKLYLCIYVHMKVMLNVVEK